MSQKQNGAEMAWNDNNNQTPPELDEVIKDFKNKFSNTFGGGSSSSNNSGVSKAAKGSFKYILILAVLVWLLSGIYIVDPAERGSSSSLWSFSNINNSRPALAHSLSY